MPQPRRTVTFAVRFDAVLFDTDLEHARPAGQATVRATKTQLERDGVSSHLLMRCDAEGRDGTRLDGLVKLYVPVPYGEWGFALVGAGGHQDPHLQVLAFGERHPKRRPSVYDVAHYRRHGQWPAGMRSPHR